MLYYFSAEMNNQNDSEIFFLITVNCLLLQELCFMIIRNRQFDSICLLIVIRFLTKKSIYLNCCFVNWMNLAWISLLWEFPFLTFIAIIVKYINKSELLRVFITKDCYKSILKDFFFVFLIIFIVQIVLFDGN